MNSEKPTDAPSNPRLLNSIRELNDSSVEDMERCLRVALNSLLESELVVGEEDGEPSTFETDDEELMLALFTDLIELHMFAPGSPWKAMEAGDALRQIKEGEYDGLVINPSGVSLALSRDDVLEFFEID